MELEYSMEYNIRLRVVCEDHLSVDIVIKRTTNFAAFKAGYSNIVQLPLSCLISDSFLMATHFVITRPHCGWAWRMKI